MSELVGSVPRSVTLETASCGAGPVTPQPAIAKPRAAENNVRPVERTSSRQSCALHPALHHLDPRKNDVILCSVCGPRKGHWRQRRSPVRPCSLTDAFLLCCGQKKREVCSMCLARPSLFSLLTVTALSAQNGGPDSGDGMGILQQMSEHCAAATSWIEPLKNEPAITNTAAAGQKPSGSQRSPATSTILRVIRNTDRSSISPTAKRRGICMRRSTHTQKSRLPPTAISSLESGK